MKRVIKASDLIDYTVEVNFGGYIGADETYEITASDEDEAIQMALEEAKDDLSIEDINQDDDDEWTVSVGFGGMVGAENEYTVYADSEDEAIEAAIEEAAYDLNATIA